MADCRFHDLPHDAAECWQTRQAEQRVRAFLKARMAVVLAPPPEPKKPISAKRHRNLEVQSRGIKLAHEDAAREAAKR